MAGDYRIDVLSLTNGEIEIKWVTKATPTNGEVVDIQQWFELIRDKIQRTFRENRKSADADNFIDPGCGSAFYGTPDPDPVICSRPYGHKGPCEGGGYTWGADLEYFEPIPAGSETAKTKANPLTEPFETPLTDEEVATVLTGVMRSKEPRKFLGVDVDLPRRAPMGYKSTKESKPHNPPPAPCQYCSGSVINHAPGCAPPSDPAPIEDIDSFDAEAFERAMEKDRRKAWRPPGEPDTPNQDEKPIVPACMLQEDCCLERGHSGKCIDVPF